jgi:cysteinyl-tRNA synthetase
MGIRFYNSMTRRKEDFLPLAPPQVRLYACGPTVYNYAHIGNLRTFMFEDLLRRQLEYRGYDVVHVMNITDVEDKIIRTVRQTGESLAALTGRYTQAFFEDLDTLGCKRPTHTPTATGSMDAIIALIQRLLDTGHAYQVDGSVYFKVSSFCDYGKLSHLDAEGLQHGASGRVDSDEYNTEDVRDFALWKAYVPEDGDIFWEAPFGKGRPGWHIECSAMSMSLLGESFDLHCGAVDLMFPHHENEIAQSEAATGKPFVTYWLHAAHLNIEGQKISKSLGNVINLRTLLDEGYDAVTVRWALRATHYRQPTNFSRDSLDAAKNAVERIREFRRRLDAVAGEGESLEQQIAACETAFGEALDDDLNISAALAAVFDFIRDVNRLIDENKLSKSGAEQAHALLDRLNEVVCLFDRAIDEVPGDIWTLVLARQDARRAKDYAKSDELRAALAARGWTVKDTAEGPQVTRA